VSLLGPACLKVCSDSHPPYCLAFEGVVGGVKAGCWLLPVWPCAISPLLPAAKGWKELGGCPLCFIGRAFSVSPLSLPSPSLPPQAIENSLASRDWNWEDSERARSAGRPLILSPRHPPTHNKVSASSASSTLGTSSGAPSSTPGITNGRASELGRASGWQTLGRDGSGIRTTEDSRQNAALDLTDAHKRHAQAAGAHARPSHTQKHQHPAVLPPPEPARSLVRSYRQSSIKENVR